MLILSFENKVEKFKFIIVSTKFLLFANVKNINCVLGDVFQELGFTLYRWETVPISDETRKLSSVKWPIRPDIAKLLQYRGSSNSIIGKYLKSVPSMHEKKAVLCIEKSCSNSIPKRISFLLQSGVLAGGDRANRSLLQPVSSTIVALCFSIEKWFVRDICFPVLVLFCFVLRTSQSIFIV